MRNPRTLSTLLAVEVGIGVAAVVVGLLPFIAEDDGIDGVITGIGFQRLEALVVIGLLFACAISALTALARRRVGPHFARVQSSYCVMYLIVTSWDLVKQNQIRFFPTFEDAAFGAVVLWALLVAMTVVAVTLACSMRGFGWTLLLAFICGVALIYVESIQNQHVDDGVWQALLLAIVVAPIVAVTSPRRNEPLARLPRGRQ